MAKGHRVIRPKPIKRDVFLKHAELAIRQTIEEAEDLFDLSTKDFANKPAFKKVYKRNSSRVVGEVYTVDYVYRLLDEGTAVRYAIMSPDFLSKTRPTSLPSRPGRGGVIRISSTPLPGIEAREFDEKVAKRMLPRLKTLARQAIKDAVRESGHSL